MKRVHSHLRSGRHRKVKVSRHYAVTLTIAIIVGSLFSYFYFFAKGQPIPPTYTLTASVVGSGSISPLGGSYPSGTIVNLVATPSSGYSFVSWSGVDSSNGNTATVVMSRDRTVTATFTGLGGSYTYESFFMATGQSAGDTHNAVVYGGYIFMALFDLPSSQIYIYKIDPRTQVVVQRAYVGNAAATDHREPEIAVTSDGNLHVVSSYYVDSQIRHWVGDTASLTFHAEHIPVAGASYARPFVTPDNNLHMLVRASSGILLISGPSWTVKSTIWKWSDGFLQGECYYYQFEYRGGRLHVAGAGRRPTGPPYEKRENAYYAYTDDVGGTWRNVRGQTILSPELVYTGDVSRVCINLDDRGYPIILRGLGVQGVRSECSVIVWDGSSWRNSILPFNLGEQIYGWVGWYSIRYHDGLIHAFIGVASSWPGYPCNLVHFYGTLDSWTRKDVTAAFVWGIEFNSLVVDGQLFVCGVQGTSVFLWRVTRQ